jgi:LmbE family N-acetylglucosaminyl deacetylase
MNDKEPEKNGGAGAITYLRREPDGRVTKTNNIAELFPDWRGSDECWMFVSPHDDDVVIGAGLTFQVALATAGQVHAVVMTDGRMGYCRFEQRRNIIKIRRAEAEKSYQILGLPPERLRFIECPDCNLNAYRGRHFTTIGEPTEIEGAGGMQNAITFALRQIRPNRVFLPTSADLHPDHQIVHEEVLISLFHAQGSIWPELGAPIAEVPKVYEFACYCDFPQPPQIRIETPAAMLETKLEGIRAYASQEQIESVVSIQRDVGPIEYLRELQFHFYCPQQYHALFAGAS